MGNGASGELHVTIEGYKTIEKLSMSLKPVTILVGPPSSGKSNILEALALLGYPGRLMAALRDTGSLETVCNIEPAPGRLLRANKPYELFPWMEPVRPIRISANTGAASLAMEVRFQSGQLTLTLLDSFLELSGRPAEIPLDVENNFICPDRAVRRRTEVEREVRRLSEAPVPGIGRPLRLYSRLYGYERFNLNARLPEVLVCGSGCPEYDLVMSEAGTNLALVAGSLPSVVHKLNQWIRDDLGAGIEVKVLKLQSRGVHFFSRDVEIVPSLLSDTLPRILYYLLGIASMVRHASMNDDLLSFVLLEEPEARVFPYGLTLLAEEIRGAVEKGVRLVVSTHNGLLVSMLLSVFRPEDIAVYYTYLDNEGYTRLLPVDLKRLAERLMMVEDLLVMSPREVEETLAQEHQGRQDWQPA